MTNEVKEQGVELEYLGSTRQTFSGKQRYIVSSKNKFITVNAEDVEFLLGLKGVRSKQLFKLAEQPQEQKSIVESQPDMQPEGSVTELPLHDPEKEDLVEAQKEQVEVDENDEPVALESDKVLDEIAELEQKEAPKTKSKNKK